MKNENLPIPPMVENWLKMMLDRTNHLSTRQAARNNVSDLRDILNEHLEKFDREMTFTRKNT